MYFATLLPALKMLLMLSASFGAKPYVDAYVALCRDAFAHAHLRIVAPILTNLWAEVVGRAHASLCQLHCAAQHLGHTKVTKFQQASSRHEDILGLDISAYSRDVHVRLDGQPSTSVQNTQTSN